MKIEKSWALTVLTVLMAILTGGMAVITIMSMQKADDALVRLESAKADSRAAYGKLFDLQEQFDDQLESSHMNLKLELWKTSSELENCRKTQK